MRTLRRSYQCTQPDCAANSVQRVVLVDEEGGLFLVPEAVCATCLTPLFLFASEKVEGAPTPEPVPASEG